MRFWHYMIKILRNISTFSWYWDLVPLPTLHYSNFHVWNNARETGIFDTRNRVINPRKEEKIGLRTARLSRGSCSNSWWLWKITEKIKPCIKGVSGKGAHELPFNITSIDGRFYLQLHTPYRSPWKLVVIEEIVMSWTLKYLVGEIFDKNFGFMCFFYHGFFVFAKFWCLSNMLLDAQISWFFQYFHEISVSSSNIIPALVFEIPISHDWKKFINIEFLIWYYNRSGISS